MNKNLSILLDRFDEAKKMVCVDLDNILVDEAIEILCLKIRTKNRSQKEGLQEMFETKLDEIIEYFNRHFAISKGVINFNQMREILYRICKSEISNEDVSSKKIPKFL